MAFPANNLFMCAKHCQSSSHSKISTTCVPEFIYFEMIRGKKKTCIVISRCHKKMTIKVLVWAMKRKKRISIAPMAGTVVFWGSSIGRK